MSNRAEFDTVGEYRIKMALQGISSYYVYMKGGLWTLYIFFQFSFLPFRCSDHSQPNAVCAEGCNFVGSISVKNLMDV